MGKKSFLLLEYTSNQENAKDLMRRVNAVFIYSGLPRLVKQNFSSIERAIKSIPGAISVFSFWESSSDTVEAIEFLKKNLTGSHFFLINPREETLDFLRLNEDKRLPSSIVNSLFQFDALLQSYNNALSLVGQNQNNLIWIRSRTDILVKRKLDVKVVEDDVVYLPGAKFGIGFTDYFSWGGSTAIESYVATYYMMLNLFSQDIFLPPEVCLGLALQQKKTKVIIDRNLPTGLLQLENDRLTLRSSFQNERSTRCSKYWGSAYYCNRDGSEETFLNEMRNRALGFSQDLVTKFKSFFSL